MGPLIEKTETEPSICKHRIDPVYKKLLKRLMDLLILLELKKRAMSGYEVISMLHMKHELLVSPGTVYALLYSMERDGLIKGSWDERKRVYRITDLGLQNANMLKAAVEEVQLPL
jgi:PadR family transcriptional regulator PadR